MRTITQSEIDLVVELLDYHGTIKGFAKRHFCTKNHIDDLVQNVVWAMGTLPSGRHLKGVVRATACGLQRFDKFQAEVRANIVNFSPGDYDIP